jgi:hypothetical protein
VDDVVVPWLTERSIDHDARFQRSSVLYGRRSQSWILGSLPRVRSSKIASQSARCVAGGAPRCTITRSNDARTRSNPGRPAGLRTCARGRHLKLPRRLHFECRPSLVGSSTELSASGFRVRLWPLWLASWPPSAPAAPMYRHQSEGRSDPRRGRRGDRREQQALSALLKSFRVSDCALVRADDLNLCGSTTIKKDARGFLIEPGRALALVLVQGVLRIAARGRSNQTR